jgi:G6PDH family F420-dependent oxidoreductase
MTRIGYFLASEEHGPNDLVAMAQRAEQAGFESLWISDHYHPWIDAQGQSAFVWCVIGGIAQTTRVPVTTAVTCPTVRIHPAIIAQAAATAACMLHGRFRLGVGSGEALNEHVLGQRWPAAPERIEMLAEAVEIMRELWTGDVVTRHGRFYDVEGARIYTLPDEPPPVAISAFGERSLQVAIEHGDGWITTAPDKEMLGRYRDGGGRGLTMAGLKVCWAADEAEGRRVAHRQWPNEGLSGNLAQELPMPAHFEQATEPVTEDLVAEKVPCGPDPELHLEAIRRYVEAGFDEVYVGQIGAEQEGFFQFFERELRPKL